MIKLAKPIGRDCYTTFDYSDILAERERWKKLLWEAWSCGFANGDNGAWRKNQKADFEEWLAKQMRKEATK